MWDLKKNFALIELLERVLVHESPTSDTSLLCSPASASSDAPSEEDLGICCDENEDHTAVVYCTTCGSHLCRACSESTHATRTLAKHRRIPLSEKPKEKHKCPNHTMQVLEFACLEAECQRTGPLMCYICKDYGRHKGHQYALMETEAESLRTVIADSVGQLRKFMEELTDTARKLGGSGRH